MEKHGIRTVVISIKQEKSEDNIDSARTITTDTGKWYETKGKTDNHPPDDQIFLSLIGLKNEFKEGLKDIIK